jgi:hypothetical protein
MEQVSAHQLLPINLVAALGIGTNQISVAYDVDMIEEFLLFLAEEVVVDNDLYETGPSIVGNLLSN